jgi:ubiquinone/menaquinone biosynthesis C-methylase UbiE
MMVEADVQTWCAKTGCRMLRGMGLSLGDAVADFGCREGRYAIPAAQVVGPAGVVVAIDRDRDAVDMLRRRARRLGLANIRTIRADFLRGVPPLRAAGFDLVLLFDVLHNVFFPVEAQRIALLQHVRTILKPGGRLAVHPTHAAEHGPSHQQIGQDIRDAGYRVLGRRRRRLLHDDRLERGWVLMCEPEWR